MKLRKTEARWIESRNRWQINVTNENGERKTFASEVGLRTRKGKLQAERKADDWLYSNSTKVTDRVGTLFDEYIGSLKLTTSEAHWRQYQSYGKNWIVEPLGRRKIGSITVGDCKDVIARANAAGISKKSQQNIRSCLSGFIRYCRDHNKTDLWYEKLTISKSAKVGKRYVLNEEEIKVLFQPYESWYIHAFRFLLLTDLRPGELMGLKWEDVSGDTITVHRAVNDLYSVTDGKNFNAHRTLKLISYAQDELKAQKAMLKKDGMLSPWVFPSPSGAPMPQDHFRRQWYLYCEEVGIGRRGETKDGNPRYITPYEFRHTNYSLNKDMPEGLKKMAFGHSRQFDGDAVYSHEMEGDRDRIMQYNTAAFDKILSTTK